MTELFTGRALITAGMKHAAHLSKAQIDEARDKTPQYLRAAVIDGDPTMGAGNVYQVVRSDVEYDYIRDSKGKYIEVPAHWKRIGGLDVGFNCTAFLAGAYDADSDIVYITDEFFSHKQPPAVVASGIRLRKGDKYPIMTDYAGTDQSDGKKLIVEYRKEKLDCRPADKAVEAGTHAVWHRLSTGRLRVFKHCTETLREYELYQRDINGLIVKKNDHGMDAMRYLVMGLKQAKLIYQTDKSPSPFKYRYNFAGS